MMTNASAALDPIATATAIALNARTEAERPAGPHGTAAIVAMSIGVLVSLVMMAAMVTSPATIPIWCAAHGGCP